MAINKITDSDWKEIMDIQRAAYSEVLPEDVSVLQSKWLMSPDTCVVFSDNEKNVLGNLLAHPWESDTPPQLNEIIPATDSKKLFLHDLALAQNARGVKIATQLVEYLIAIAMENDFSVIRLIAVQNSQLFWSKFGFAPVNEMVKLEDYGERAILMQLALEP